MLICAYDTIIIDEAERSLNIDFARLLKTIITQTPLISKYHYLGNN